MGAWQDRAWVVALALAGSVLVLGALLGIRSLWALALAGLVLAAGTFISARATLVRLDEAERRRRLRSVAIALVLAALVVTFYAATIVRLGGNVFNRPI